MPRPPRRYPPPRRRGVLPVLAEWMGHSYRPRRRRPVPLWILLVIGLLFGGAAVLAKNGLHHSPALLRPAATTAPAPSPVVNQATPVVNQATVQRTSWPGPAGVAGVPVTQTPTITP